MSGLEQGKIYYWDACAYLAWIKGETSHGPDCLAALNQVANENENRRNIVITSTIIFIEVLAASIGADSEARFRKLFRRGQHIAYDVDPSIALRARSFREEFLKHKDGKKLHTPDAIHLATASIYRAHEMWTFDDGKKDNKSVGLLNLNRNPKFGNLVICKPYISQGLLQLQINAKADLTEEEASVLDVLIKVGGQGTIGFVKERSLIDDQPKLVVQALSDKGYVTLMKTGFMVVRPPPPSS